MWGHGYMSSKLIPLPFKYLDTSFEFLGLLLEGGNEPVSLMGKYPGML